MAIPKLLPAVRGAAVELISATGDDRLTHAHRFLIDWSADGDRLVTAQAGAVFAWETRSGRLQHAVALPGRTTGVNDLAVSADGAQAAVAMVANDATVRYRIELASARVTRLDDSVAAPLRFDRNGDLVTKAVPRLAASKTAKVAFSENYRFAAVVDQTVTVWSVTPRARIGRIRDAAGAVGAAVSNDGRFVALWRGVEIVLEAGPGPKSRTRAPRAPHLDLWDLHLGRRIWRDTRRGDRTWQFTGDGKFLVGPRSRLADEIIHTATGEVLRFGKPGIRGVAPNSRFVAVQDHSGLSIIAVDSRETVFAGVHREVAAMSPDGSAIVAVGADGALQLERGPECFRLGQSLIRSRDTLVFTADGRYLLGGLGNWARRPRLLTWDAKTGQLIQFVRDTAGTGGVVHPLPATMEAVFQGGDGKLWFIDALSGANKRIAQPPRTGYSEPSANGAVTRIRIRSGGQPDQLSDTPIRATSDGRYLVVGSAIAGTTVISIWDTAVGGVVADIPQGFWIAALALSDDDRLIAVAGRKGQLRLWDRSSQRRLPLAEAHAERVTALAFAPGGGLLATAGRDHLVRVFDTSGGDVVGTIDLSSRFDDAIGLWFSHDGTILTAHTARGLQVRVRVVAGARPE